MGFTEPWRDGRVFDLTLIECSDGFISFRASGEKAKTIFSKEAGGHRFQRVPPTEKRGRVQTSTITVAVLDQTEADGLEINEFDLEWKFCRGSGKGGQHRNKTDSAVWLTHKPTKLQVWCESERSQWTNKQEALRKMKAKLLEKQNTQVGMQVNGERRDQIGSGMRGEKIRTIRVRDNVVTNNVTGRKIRYTDYVKGDFGSLA